MHFGAEVERARHGLLRVDVERCIADLVVGNDRPVPIGRIEMQQCAERVLGGTHRGHRVDQRLFLGGDLHARLEDVQRRRSADVDADLRDAGLVASEEERFLHHIDELPGVDQIEIPLLDVVRGADQRAAEDFAIDAERIGGDGDAAPRDVDAKVAQERLVERQAEVAVEGRVANDEAAGGRAAVVVEGQPVIAAGGDDLLDAEVPDGQALRGRLQAAASRSLAAAVRQRGSAEPVEQPILRAEALAGHLGGVALELDADVALHGRVDRGVEREMERARIVEVLVRVGRDGGRRGLIAHRHISLRRVGGDRRRLRLGRCGRGRRRFRSRFSRRLR